MCGRFSLSQERERVEAHFGVAGIVPYPPRYNIAPTQPILAVTAAPRRREGSNLPDREALVMRWGLLPSWVKDPGDFPLLINARAETAATKASFRAAMRHRRCIIPASGFYEWKRDKPGRRSQPFWIRPADGALVGFAGLHETWIGPDGSEIDTCAILTTQASRDLAFIHERVPVTLMPQDYAAWLDCRDRTPADVAALLAPPPEGFYEAIPVSDRVNKVANADPSVQERVQPKPFADPGRTAQGAPAKADDDGQGTLL